MIAKRIDANQNEIVAVFRKLGFSVAVTSDLGRGFPDLVIARGGLTYLVEIKDGEKPPSQQKLTPLEDKFMRNWNAKVFVINSVDQVLAFVKYLA